MSVQDARNQRLVALARANEVRAYRYGLKADIAAGKVKLATVLTGAIDDRLVGMRAVALLTALPLIGEQKAEGFLREIGATSYVHVGNLSRSQRGRLLAEVAAWEERRESRR